MLAPVGSNGGITLYSGDADEHAEFSLQFCNERLMMITHKQDGRDIYAWKSKEPHDYLDAIA